MIEILVIDDSLGKFKPALQQALKGYVLHFAYSGREGLEILGEQSRIALVLLDIKMPPDFADEEGREGIEVLKRIRQEYPELPVVMLSALHDIDLVVEAIQAGAFHYIPKPPDRDKLRDTVKRALVLSENADLKEQVTTLARKRDAVLSMQFADLGPERSEFQGLVGAHPLMRQLYTQIELVAPHDDMNVFVRGETGSGKDLVARAVHACSPRRDKPFVAVNCTTFSESLLEDELFGHKKGAFSEAHEDRDGLFVSANGGTVFLDEVGDMSPKLQAQLLRVSETGEVKPIGSDKTIVVDVRIVSATFRNLAKATETGEFRQDLYYRLVEWPLNLPPLRQRREDIPLLAQRFLDDGKRNKGGRRSLDAGALAALCEYDWPGNVRHLRTIARRVAVLARNECITEAEVRHVLLSQDEALTAQPGKAPSVAPPPQTRETPPPPPAPPQPDDVAPEPADAPAPATASALPPAPTPEAATLPEIGKDYVAWTRDNGMQALKNALELAHEHSGTGKLPDMLPLLGIPPERYDSFRRFLHRNHLKEGGGDE